MYQESTLPAPSVGDDSATAVGTLNEEDITVECEFKRGVCKVHNIKGKKLVLRTSKWCNVKGTFKWRYSSKVVWQCLARKNPVAKIQDQPPADDNTSNGDSLCGLLSDSLCSMGALEND